MIPGDEGQEPEGDERTTLDTWELFRSLSAYFLPHKGKVALVLFACSLETGFYWIVPLAFRHLIDDTLAIADRAGLIQVLVLLGVGGVVASVASLWRGRLWARVESQVVSDIRFRLFHQLQRLSVSAYAGTSTGTLLSHFSNDLSSVSNALTMAVVWGALPGLDCILGTVILFVLDWRLACLAALVWPWCLLVPPRIARRAAPTANARKQREAEMLEVVQEQIATQAVIRAYGLARLRMTRFFHHDARLFEASVRSAFLTALMDQSAMSGILFLQVLTLASGAWLAFEGEMTIGTLAAFQALFLGVSTSLLYFTQYLRGLLPARAGMQRINEFLAAGGAVDDPPGAGVLPPFSGEIVLDQVSFAHDDTVVLRDVSLRIPHGAHVAVVGASGSGKSTLVSLLLRFHEPATGVIRVDGVDLTTVTQESWRSQLGVVFQDNLLFRASLGDNIRMGRAGAPDRDVEEAARQAGIDAAIRRLPDGYATQAGALGGRLSGGERQRIALARALVRQPRILLLDEATSSLDPQTEAEVNATLRQAAAGRTVIAVTHRLQSVAGCDRIFVMERGTLAEQGTHAELIAAGGVYANLWQSDRHREDGRDETAASGFGAKMPLVPEEGKERVT